jgi:hypothetical protein
MASFFKVYIGDNLSHVKYGEKIELDCNDGEFYYKTTIDLIFKENRFPIKDCISLDQWRDMRINILLNE